MAQEKIIRKGKIQLTDEELASYADELANVSIEETGAEAAIEAFKANAKETLKELKLMLADLHGQRQALATKVATRTEERSVSCSVYYDFDGGFRYIVSDDPTAGVLEREPLSNNEKQLSLKDKRIVADPEMVVEWNNELDEQLMANAAESRVDDTKIELKWEHEPGDDVQQVTNFDLEAEAAAKAIDVPADDFGGLDKAMEEIYKEEEGDVVTDQELLDGINRVNEASIEPISIEEDNHGQPDDESIIDVDYVEEDLDLFYYSKAVISNNLVCLRFDYPECQSSQLSGVALLDVNNEDDEPKTLQFNDDENLLRSYRAQLDAIDNYDYDEPPIDDEIPDE